MEAATKNTKEVKASNMNIIEKIKIAGLQNGLTFNISGDQKTISFYNEGMTKPYKILSLSTGPNKVYYDLLTYLIQNKEGCEYFEQIGGYKAIFIEGEFIIVIKSNCNGYNYICFYKNKK